MLGDDEASPDDISSGNYPWKKSPCSSVSEDSLSNITPSHPGWPTMAKVEV